VVQLQLEQIVAQEKRYRRCPTRPPLDSRAVQILDFERRAPSKQRVDVSKPLQAPPPMCSAMDAEISEEIRVGQRRQSTGALYKHRPTRRTGGHAAKKPGIVSEAPMKFDQYASPPVVKRAFLADSDKAIELRATHAPRFAEQVSFRDQKVIDRPHLLRFDKQIDVERMFQDY